MVLKIKQEYAGVIIGFNNCSLPLGQRTEHDLTILFEKAKKRNNQKWLNMFEKETLPTEKEIDMVKEKSFTEKQSKKNIKDAPDEQ